MTASRVSRPQALRVIALETKLQIATYREFNSSLNRLYKRGGQFQKAAERIGAAMQFSGKEELLPGLKPTGHGEKRIDHCVKYDLTGAARLITVQTDGFCVLVFCGSHPECDEWLERNRGFQPVVGPDFVVGATYVSSGEDSASRIAGPRGHSLEKLFERLPVDLLDVMVTDVPRSVVRELEGLEASVTEGELWRLVAGIEDADRRLAVHDVFALLRQDKTDEAHQRVLLFLGESRPLATLTPDQLPDVIDSDVIKRIPPGSPQYAEAVVRFMRSSRYRDWMLFMHPEQEAVVEEDFNGPAKLTGVSGSGKTCVVVQRAVRLARKYQDGHILVLTLNKALARMISELVDEVAAEDERRRIDVRAFFTLCRTLLKEFEPENDRIYNDITWKLNEHVDEIWQEYYRCEANNPDARVLHPVHDSLLSRGLRPESYLREEFDWLRSALTPTERPRYLEMARPGRSVPLAVQLRQGILTGLEGWEEKMVAIGVADGLGMAQALAKHLEGLEARYRCVLVDEAQDFGNLELAIVRRLVKEDENSLLLCGDAAQAVTTKYQSLRSIGIDVPGARSRKLALNYRNSRDVLRAAYEVLKENMTEGLADREDFEVLDPEYSTFSGAAPLLLRANSLDDEIGHALRLIDDTLAGRPGGKACVAICGYSLFELVGFGKILKLPVLDGNTPIEARTVFLSDLEQTKGFEFDMVCVLNCSAGILPTSTAPVDEQYRDLARLYVAMTRAKTDLVLSWSGSCSVFLTKAKDSFLTADWKEYASGPHPHIAPPKRLEAHRKHGTQREPWRHLSGEQFLYTDSAIGLSLDLITKVRDLVDGQGLRRGVERAERIKWRTLGDAADDFAAYPRARAVWGPEGGRQFGDLIGQLGTAEGR